MVVGGLVVGGVVGGCSDESDGDVVATPVTPASPTPTPSTTSTPSPTEPSGSDSPDPVEPSLPAAAEGDSVRSAKAFVRHYIELLNYAMTTGDTDAFRAAATDGCGGCQDYVDLFGSTYDEGGFYRSRGWSLDRVLVGGQDESAVLFSIKATAAPIVFRERSGTGLKRSARDPISFSLLVERGDESWSMEDFSA